MVEKLLINTSLGRSVLNLEERVFSYVEDAFLEKPAIDLNIGESLLYKKEYISASLEEVEPFLRRSERYSSAEQMLHETNSRGEAVPKLRTKLLRGAVQRGMIYEDNLENKILLNGDDISSDSYKIIRDEINNRLRNHNMEITDSAIDSWLKGKTVSPREWGMYSVLAEINPEFIDFNPINRSRESYFFNYKLYTVIRQGIMRWLSNPRHAQPSSEHELRESLDISLSQEIGLVFDHFVRDIDEEYAVAQVLELQRLPENSPLSKRRIHEPRLSKGVVTGLSGPYRTRKKEVGEIILGKKIFEHTFYKIIDFSFGEKIEEYISNLSLDKIRPKSEDVYNTGSYRRLLESPLGPIIEQGFKRRIEEGKEESYEKLIKPTSKRLFAARVIDNHVSIRGEPKFKNFFTFFLKEMNDVDFAPVYNQFIEELYTGRIDLKLNAPFGTTLRVLDLLKRHYRNIPKSVLEYQDNMEKIVIAMSRLKGGQMAGSPDVKQWQTRLRDLERKQKKVKMYIRSNYPYFRNKYDIDISLRGDEFNKEQRNEFFDRYNLSALKSFD